MDQLVGMLAESGSLKISDAAKELGVDKDRVESWAKMLDKADIVRIHYSVVGGALLRKGPKFDMVCKGVSAAPVPSPSNIPPLTPRSFQPPAPLQQKQQPAPLPQKPQPTEGGEYLLIRRRIDEEEKTIEDDLRKLREEQATVARYMDEIEGEERKLADYVEALRSAVEKMNAKVESTAQSKV